MKKSLIIIFLSVVCTSVVQAQLSLNYRLGYGTYRMKSVSEFQDYILKESGLPAQIVEQFPGYLNHRLYFGMTENWPHYKVYLGYVTTGGRISLVDYTGKWNFDMLLNGFQAGFHMETPLNKNQKIELKGYIDLGVTTTMLNINEYLKLYDEESEQSQLFFAYGFDFQLGLELCCKFPVIDVGCYLGYEQDFSTPFYLDGDYEIQLGTSQNDLVHPGWAGLRTGISATYTFGRKKYPK